MPNEQTSVPLFTSGEVLTAANMNLSAGTGVPVFTNTTTRDAGFGGANEKVLAEGQLCYLSSTNVVQYYDGAAWATVGPATASAFTFINSASFSAVSSVSLATNTFSATYDNYKIIFLVTSSSANDTFDCRFRAAGADNSTTNYLSNWVASGASVSGGVGGTSKLSLAFVKASGVQALTLDILSPVLASPSYCSWQGRSNDSGAAVAALTGAGTFTGSTSFDAMSFFPNSGTITGSYRVYGYSNS